MCLLDQRPTPAKPRTAPSESFLDDNDEDYGRPKKTHPHDPSCESFMDDPEDFKKRSRTGSPYENPTSHPTNGQSNGEHHTTTRAAIASTTPGWLYGRQLRDGPGIPESTRAQGRPLSVPPRPERTNHLHSARRRVVAVYPWISWHESTAVDPDRAPGGQGVVRLHVLDAPLHPTGDAADLNAGTTPRGTTRYPRHSPGVPSRCAADTPPRYRTCIRSVLPAGGADGRRLVGSCRRSRLTEPNLTTRRLAVERVPGERGVSGAAGAVAQR
jgi:hypothetical protein